MKEIILKHKGKNFIIILLIIMASGFKTLGILMTSQFLNSLVSFNVDEFIKNAVWLVVWNILYLVFMSFQLKYGERVKQDMSMDLRNQILTKIEGTTSANFHENSPSVYSSWLSNDLLVIETQGFSSFYNIISGIVSTVLAIISLFFIHWSLLLVTVFSSLILIYFSNRLQSSMSEAAKTVTVKNQLFLQIATEFLKGYDVFRAFQVFPFAKEKIIKAGEELSKAKCKQANIFSLITLLTGFLGLLSQLTILILTGFLALIQLIPVGAILATGNFAGTIGNTLQSVGPMYSQLKATASIFEKFSNFKTIDKDNITVNYSNLSSGYSLKNVSYSYEKHPVVENISFNFELHKKYLILGNSGSGKSTLLNILTKKLENYAGMITFNGIDLKKISLEKLQKDILYIEQSPYLFSGTIRENLSLGENFSDDSINNVLEKTLLIQEISLLPDGIDTRLDEEGTNLSGGQKQRLVLARGLLRNKKLIFLDESTSNLDNKNVSAIEDMLLASDDITLIIVSHNIRESVKDKVDGILYLS